MWPAEWTAIGTILLAAMTVGAVVTTIVITRQDRKRANSRFANEQARHEAEVAEERRLADARLKNQQGEADEQFRSEQWRAKEREQYTEAYAVQVSVGEFTATPGPPNDFGDPGPAAAKRFAALVVNRGSYAITRVTARFSPDGMNLLAVAIQPELWRRGCGW